MLRNPSAPPGCVVENLAAKVFRLNIVFVHCHFERGGVTQVVRNHLHALRLADHPGKRLLFSGNRAGDLDTTMLEDATHQVIQGLDYDAMEANSDHGLPTIDDLFRRFQSALHAHGCRPTDTVLHWHNHSLGKNSLTIELIKRLAKHSWRFLLQIHDFAEDYRPETLMRLIDAGSITDPASLDAYLYPCSNGIHYATLTSADRGVLNALGMDPSQTHVLPNSVQLGTDAPSDKMTKSKESDAQTETALQCVRTAFGLASDARWCVYPVRGIRRKNVGELLLLSRLLPEPLHFGPLHFGLTLRPTTQIELDSYLRWKALAEKVAPRVVFDAGHHEDVSFETNLAASEFVLSTSVAEGFGMVFLEPWLAGKPVIARRIPAATDDFITNGIRLPLLYDAIPIPGSQPWVKERLEEYRESCQAALQGLPATFSPPLEPAELTGSHDAIDFAQLRPKAQAAVLERCRQDAGFQNEIKARSADLLSTMNNAMQGRLVSDVPWNRQRIAESYGLAKQGGDLWNIYQSILASSPPTDVMESPLHAGRGWSAILQAHDFFPCRTETEIAD